MNKVKVLLFAAIFAAGLVATSEAGETVAVPAARQSYALATADYGGTFISTSQFSLNMTTVTCRNTAAQGCSGVFYGAIFSSGSPTDFISVFDATSTAQALLQGEIARIYNINGSTVGAGVPGIAAGFSGPPKPIRYVEGLLWRPNTNAYNIIGVQFYQDPATLKQ